MIQCLACEDANCSPPKAKCVNAIACFQFHMVHVNGTTNIKKGCLENEFHARIQCNRNATTESHSFVSTCCFSDFCNDWTNTTLTPPKPKPPSPWLPDLLIIATVASLMVGLLFLLFACCLVKKQKRSNYSSPDTSIEKGYDFDDNSETSGSGLGMPLMTDRTLSKDISLVGRFYKGKSTEVWKGKWKGLPVAVKVFYTRDEHLFERELEVYKSLNRHQNILELLASDCISIDCCTQQWLVTSYYELGSLFDYLSVNTIDQHQCLSFLFGMIHGLDYLHSETASPQIAHRDIKSKNILVKDHLNVCIADFGLAVTYLPESRKIINGERYKIGTIRYMAPEILNDRFDGTKFESHKKTDIYSLSLVMWETLRRCLDFNGKFDNYSLPFEGVVPSDPTFEDMAKVVCLDEQRPLINERMSSDPVIARIVKLIEECWNGEPSKRLTVLRLKKSLIKINSDI